MQTKHSTESLARKAARRLGSEHCQIVESKDGDGDTEAPWIFYLETGDDCSMIRAWERLTYEGPGRKA